MISRPVKILLLSAVLLIAAFTAYSVFSRAASRWLEKRVAAAVAGTAGADCSIGRVRVGLFHGIRLESVRIAETGADSGPVLTISSVRIHSPLPEWVLRGRLFLHIQADTISVDARRFSRLSGTGNPGGSRASLPAVGGRFPWKGEIRFRLISVHQGRPDSAVASIGGMVLAAVKPAQSPSFSFRVSADSVRYFCEDAAFVFQGPALTGILDSSAVTIRSFESAVPGGRVTGDGRIGPLGRDWRIRGSLVFRTAVESWPARVFEKSGVPVPSSGVVQGRLNAEGSLRHPAVSWDMDGRDLAFRTVTVRKARSAGAWAGDTVALDAFSVTAGDGSVTGSGAWTFRGTRRARFSASFRRLGIPLLSGWLLPSDVPVRGALSGDIRIDAFPDDPGRLSAASTITATDLRFSGRPLDPVRLDLGIENGRADVRMTGNGLSARLEGDWTSGLSGSSGGAFSVRLNDPSLTVFLPKGWHAAGPAEVTGRYRVLGETVEADGDFFLAGVRTADWALDSLAGPLAVRLDPRKRSWSMEGADILCAARAFRPEDTLRMDGRIRLAASLNPEDGHPAGALAMTVRPFSIGGVTVDSAALDADLEHQNLRIRRLSFTQESNSVLLTGSIPVGPERNGTWKPDGTRPFDLRLSGEDIQLAALRPFLAGAGSIGGRSTFDLRMTGVPGNSSIDGQWSVSGGSIRQTGIPDIDSVSWTAVFLDSTLRIDSLSGRVNGLPLTIASDIGYRLGEGSRIEGTARFLRPEGIRAGFFLASDSMRSSLTVDSLRLALVDSLLPRSFPLKNMSGVVRADLALFGRPGSPLLTGRVSGDRVNFSAAGMDLGAGNGRVALFFDRDRISVDTLSLPVLGGYLDVRGRLSHEGGRIRSWDLDADIRNVRVREPGRWTFSVDRSRLNLFRDKASNRLTGEVVLGESRYLQAMKATDFLSLTRSPARPSPRLPDELKDMELNIRVTGGRDVWIDNNLVRVRFQPELAVSGRVQDPELTGRLTTLEGTAQYLDHAFTLKKGIADFTDPGKVNPILDIEAETRLKNYQTYSGTAYTVSLTLQGPLDKAVFDLTSVPQAPRTDILSLLTFGATRDELNRTLPSSDRNGGMSDVLIERAKSLTSRRVASTAENYMGTLFRLDSMSIEGNLFRFDKEWGPRLQASKRVSRNVALNYSTTVGHMNEESVRLNVRIDRRFSVEGQVDRIGRSGIDLKYKIRFK